MKSVQANSFCKMPYIALSDLFVARTVSVCWRDFFDNSETMMWACEELNIDMKKKPLPASAIAFEIPRLRILVKSLFATLNTRGVTSEHFSENELVVGIQSEILLNRIFMTSQTLFSLAIAIKPEARIKLTKPVFDECIRKDAIEEAEGVVEPIKADTNGKYDDDWWGKFGAPLVKYYCTKNDLEKAINFFENHTNGEKINFSKYVSVEILLESAVKNVRWDLFDLLLMKCPDDYFKVRCFWFFSLYIKYEQTDKAIELLRLHESRIINGVVNNFELENHPMEQINRELHLLFEEQLLNKLVLQLRAVIDQRSKYRYDEQVDDLVDKLLLCEWPGKEKLRHFLINAAIESKLLSEKTLVKIIKHRAALEKVKS